VTLSASASGSPAGDGVMFYPPVVSAPTIVPPITLLDGTPLNPSTDCAGGAEPLEIVTVQVQSVEHRVSQTLSLVKGPAL